jgi:hypothetical protein
LTQRAVSSMCSRVAGQRPVANPDWVDSYEEVQIP